MLLHLKLSTILSVVLLLSLYGCASTAPQPVGLVNHLSYGQGLYQLKVTDRDPATASSQWQTAASRLCPSGFEQFDQSNSVVIDPNRPDPSTEKTKSFLGGGLIGLAMDDSAQSPGASVSGYLLCSGSGLDIASAKKIVYSRH